MVVEYEERIPDFMIFSQPKAEGTYSTVNAIPSSVGHPILIVEIKPLRLGGSLQDVIATMNHASATRQTSVQACLGLDEYKLDAITVMTAVGLYVRFEEYRREDVASFLRRAIPLEGAPPSRYARPSSSSEVMYIFNDDMSDYSPGVLERWREALQLA
ncbi:hypothetical protein HETIRDRAFT_406625 [Heterobasidion irregulare TC 32-1]|uniref:Uncharacterized protein n=1 Tax=Heterobasidion irregulare (strain TC 32-1) TaxID=747525 RepID=W4KLF7_HETIT|nr:uncharacterized protein HETIRDRAFT_406625 [Heterobasidion irregulare TC 32-1]ETW86688.1 hypothetical protein HETIRDRAFT_406625 [Heterobasidion irregulare TC 32-1]